MSDSSMDQANMFPPHARGWTLCKRDQIDSLCVSPACAGMDP